MVVAIIGIIFSVAYPLSQRALLRSKTAERTYMMRSIHDTIEDVYRVYGRFPPDGTEVVSAYNPVLPPFPATSAKRRFDAQADGWPILTTTLAVEGDTYYSYQFVGIESLGLATVSATGDLDADGVPSIKQVFYTRSAGSYLATLTVPPDGEEDAVSF